MASKLVRRLVSSKYLIPVRNIATTNSFFKVSRSADEGKPVQPMQQRVGIIGIPEHHGQRQMGVELGPTVLREASLISRLEAAGADVKDYGDIEITTIEDDEPFYNMRFPKTHAVKSQKISDEVAKIVSDGRMCITLGGDNSLAFGSVHGHASVRPDVCAICLVANPDLNTPITSWSGNFHGMHNSFLIHDMQQYVPALAEFSDLKSCINADDIVFIGLRGMDPAEKAFLEKYRIRNYSMHEVDQKGIATVIQETLDYLNGRSPRPIHLSIDVDSLDPIFASSTGTSVCGGLTLREVMYLTEEVYKTGKLSVVDLVEINPKLRPEKAAETIEAGINILTTAVGDRRGGVIPANFHLEKPEISRADTFFEYDKH